MKHLKTYEGFLNYLKGKSKEQIIKSLENLTDNEIIEKCIKYDTFELLPRNDDGYCVYDGLLDLSLSDIDKLPYKLHVKDHMICTDNNLTELPNGLIVDKSLHCGGNYIENIPSDLKVGDDLFIQNNQLIELPENLHLNNDLHCEHNNLIKLPNNLIVDDNLYCYANNLTELSDNLYVGGDLVCDKQKSGIKLELPKTAIVRGDFIN